VIREQSKKEHDFKIFSDRVCDHIFLYVIQQYGDQPDPHIQGMSIEEIKGKLSSYVARIGRVQSTRGIDGALRDCYKIAHFAQYLHDKIEEVSCGD
jgi:hypothetical protein